MEEGARKGGEAEGKGDADRGEELKGIISEKMEVVGRGGGGGEGMLVEKGGAFDLKFRPGGNRGGVTHSNACFPPLLRARAAVGISDSHKVA